MIVICGVDEFPSGPWTHTLAAHFADRLGADLRIVDGGPAAHHVAAVDDPSGGVLLFGHGPPRGVAAALRDVTRVDLPGIGHLPHTQEPATTLRLLHAFLDSL